MKPQFKSKIKSAMLALCFWRKPEPVYIVPCPEYQRFTAEKYIKELEPETKNELKILYHFFREYEIEFEHGLGTCVLIEKACCLVGMSPQETYKVSRLYRIIAKPNSASHGFLDIPDEIFEQHFKRIRQLRVRFFLCELQGLLREAERRSK